MSVIKSTPPAERPAESLVYRPISPLALAGLFIAGAYALVMIGFNDTPWGRGDDPCHVAPDFPVVMWDQITEECTARVTGEYADGLEGVLDTVSAVAPEACRAVTFETPPVARAVPSPDVEEG